jgi:hypothetical protein
MWQIIKRIFKERTRVHLLAPIDRIRAAEQQLSEGEDMEAPPDFTLEQVRHLLRLGESLIESVGPFLDHQESVAN